MARALVKQESVEWEMQKSADQSKTFVYTKKRGYDVTRNPHLNKGMAFSLEERLQLGIHGLLPPCFLSQDVQVLRFLRNYELKKDDLDRYVFLMGLQDRNEKLFYRVLTSDIERFMPIAYTPTVGLACQQYGLTFRRPRGLFITIHDRSHISTLLQSWPEKDIRELLKDPLYIGLRHKRIRGQAYDELLDEFMKAITDRYGVNCLIQFEDFANINAFRLLSKYRNKYLTFNDDIQGTAAVAVAGLLAALCITKSKMCNHTIVFQGAGEAAMGIAELIIMAMKKEGLPREQCIKKIWMVDSKGLIVKGRDHLTHEKERFAHEHAQMKKLEDVVKELKPTAIIGVAAITGAFTEEIIKAMASFNERPIIFALSNPTSKAECTAEQCYTLTEGRGIFASGSPFDLVTLPDGRKFYPGQGNNAYVFPGVGLGVTACAMRHIPENIFLITAEAIAELVTEKDLAEGRLYPPLNSIREVSIKLAVKIVEYAYKNKMATLHPEPHDKEAFVHSLIFSTDYEEFAVDSYSWPENAMAVQTCKL
ncbi:NADP-dependent malic enzyme-like [Sinocyclocheilus grahami]|uniref:NADP-dependent malic enzyme-like n=1 Tax=Sinocyclocheilus grahami TaxID=75366 RepID=UPI0007ACE2C1|nr:PREDICTED: NADP-dependent malic enzyme-like [Sinocyclocheilus grahami]